MSWQSKQLGFSQSEELGRTFISTNGTTLPVSPATMVSGTDYIIANVNLAVGVWLLEVQLDITGDATTNFEAIQIDITNDFGVYLYDNLLVGTTLKSTTQIELNGTYPIFVSTFSGSGNVTVIAIPTFTGTAPTTQGLIRPFKII